MGLSPASEVASKQLSTRQAAFRKGKRLLDKVIETKSRVRIEGVGRKEGDWLCLCLRVWEGGHGRLGGTSLQSRMAGTPEKGLKALIRGGSLTLEKALVGVEQTCVGQP